MLLEHFHEKNLLETKHISVERLFSSRRRRSCLSFSPKRIDANAAQKYFSMFSFDPCTHLSGEEVNQVEKSRHRRPGHVVILCSFVQCIYFLYLKYCKKNIEHVSRSRRRKKLQAINIASCAMLTKRELLLQVFFSKQRKERGK